MSEKSESETKRHEDFYNVAVYIDYENVVKILMKDHANPIHDQFFDKLRVWAKEKNMRLVKTAVYCNFDVEYLYESHHQSLLQSYGVETIHTSNQGKNYADLKIAIDVLNEMYTNSNIDEFIIMSNDKDMTPLLNTIKANKRRVSVITTGNAYNKSLVEFADDHFEYKDIIATRIEFEPYIASLSKKSYSNIFNTVQKGIDSFKKEKEKNKKATFSKHVYLSNIIENHAKFYHIMKYELLYLMAQRYGKGDLFFYTKGNQNDFDQLCLLPKDFKSTFIEYGIISEKDICKINVTELANKKYDEYLK